MFKMHKTQKAPPKAMSILVNKSKNTSSPELFYVLKLYHSLNLNFGKPKPHTMKSTNLSYIIFAF